MWIHHQGFFGFSWAFFPWGRVMCISLPSWSDQQVLLIFSGLCSAQCQVFPHSQVTPMSYNSRESGYLVLGWPHAHSWEVCLLFFLGLLTSDLVLKRLTSPSISSISSLTYLEWNLLPEDSLVWLLLYRCTNWVYKAPSHWMLPVKTREYDKDHVF